MNVQEWLRFILLSSADIVSITTALYGISIPTIIILSVLLSSGSLFVLIAETQKRISIQSIIQTLCILCFTFFFLLCIILSIGMGYLARPAEQTSEQQTSIIVALCVLIILWIPSIIQKLNIVVGTAYEASPEHIRKNAILKVLYKGLKKAR